MSLRYIVIAVLAAVILGMLALLWPAYQSVAARRDVRREISEPVKLAETLQKMQEEANANLAAARLIGGAFGDMQKPLDSAAVPNPFGPPAQAKNADVQLGKGERPAVDPIEVQLASLNLKGTVAAGRASLALINDEVFRLGDAVNGLRIVAIDEAGVTLSAPDGKSRTLALEGWQISKERTKQ